jgi:hypothetical protein
MDNCFRTMRQQARDTATRRGHLLGPWIVARAPTRTDTGANAYCCRCGMTVAVRPRSAIVGAAVAADCPGAQTRPMGQNKLREGY